MKIPKIFQQKKILQVTARALPDRELEECEEPNVRLSSALIVVILLHLVAVGGIYAFSSIKAHQAPPMNPAQQSQLTHESVPPAKIEAAPSPSTVATKQQAPAKNPDHKQADSTPKPIARDSGQVYTVVKGDNPVNIAKHFGVSYDELLKLNKIEDPKKLQIGQKLHIPPKIKTT